MSRVCKLLLLFGLLSGACRQSPPFDIIIKNGTVYDGTGTAPVRADIGISGDKITAAGDLAAAKAGTVIEAEGLAVAPGFVDLHVHLEPIFELSTCESHLRQGVTTALGGPDGGGELPLGRYLDSLAGVGVGMNAGFLAGHNTVRTQVMQLENRSPTARELEQMKSLVSQAMQEGAFGLSTGLKYVPGAYSKLEEVVALSAVAARHGGFYTSHLREEGLGLLEGVREAIQIGRQAGIPVVLTHHKVVGKPMWGASVKTLAMVDSARAAGQDVTLDQYPYTASQSTISLLIPAWALSGGKEAFRKRLRDPVLGDSIRSEVLFNLQNDRGGGDLSRVQFAKVVWQRDLEGKTLADWAAASGLKPTLGNGVELVLRAQQNGGASCIYHVMHEDDVIRIMQHPQTMIASDGRLTKMGEGSPHPRAYGTFPRVLGHYVRDTKVLTLPQAIHKMTGMPAQRMGLTDRGKIAPGMFADLVIFDPATVGEKATYADPHHYPAGIRYVVVNGTFAVKDGVLTAKKAGKILYGPARQKIRMKP